MAAWAIQYFLGKDPEVRVKFVVKYVTGSIPEQNKNIIEAVLAHRQFQKFLGKNIKKVLWSPLRDFFVRLSTACARTARGVSSHGLKMVEKRRISALQSIDTLVCTGKGKFVHKQTLFGKVPILMKEDTSVTVRHIKDVALFKAKRLLPQFVSGLSSATSRALHFQQTIKMMVYAVVFFSQNCGFQTYKLIGPDRVRHTDYHILFCITLDGSDRTARGNVQRCRFFNLLSVSCQECTV